MDFSKEQSEKPISDADQMGIAADKLISELRGFGKEMSDVFSARRERERKEIENYSGRLNLPQEVQPPKPAVEENVKLPELGFGDEKKLRDLLRAYGDLRKGALKNIESGKLSPVLLKEEKIRLDRIDEALRELENIMTEFAPERTRRLLDAVIKEAEDQGKENK